MWHGMACIRYSTNPIDGGFITRMDLGEDRVVQAVFREYTPRAIREQSMWALFHLLRQIHIHYGLEETLTHATLCLTPRQQRFIGYDNNGEQWFMRQIPSTPIGHFMAELVIHWLNRFHVAGRWEVHRQEEVYEAPNQRPRAAFTHPAADLRRFPFEVFQVGGVELPVDNSIRIYSNWRVFEDFVEVYCVLVVWNGHALATLFVENPESPTWGIVVGLFILWNNFPQALAEARRLFISREMGEEMEAMQNHTLGFWLHLAAAPFGGAMNVLPEDQDEQLQRHLDAIEFPEHASDNVDPVFTVLYD